MRSARSNVEGWLCASRVGSAHRGLALRIEGWLCALANNAWIRSAQRESCGIKSDFALSAWIRVDRLTRAPAPKATFPPTFPAEWRETMGISSLIYARPDTRHIVNTRSIKHCVSLCCLVLGTGSLICISRLGPSRVLASGSVSSACIRVRLECLHQGPSRVLASGSVSSACIRFQV
jgi:hypothetical protein